ncbi:hypothetical protein TRVA0_020S01310 [Trichomonascus vanleenenianus]|uniref:Cbp6p n=1 Tax=Trichomonascus vanleenenianus TaxID=2268995 RepID=UPI003EC9CE20
MSAKSKALNNLVAAFKKWPSDSQRVYFSFKDYQIKRFEEALVGSQAQLPPAENLEAQAAATNLLTADANLRKFPVKRLLRPEGMPNYYTRIIREADTTTRKKESFFTAFRESVFGWFK